MRTLPLDRAPAFDFGLIAAALQGQLRPLGYEITVRKGTQEVTIAAPGAGQEARVSEVHITLRTKDGHV